MFFLPVKASEKKLLVAIIQLRSFFCMDSNYQEIPGKTGLFVYKLMAKPHPADVAAETGGRDLLLGL